jgi:hypothetical protein
MTDRFAGGEDSSFTLTGSLPIVTSGGLFRSGFARCSLGNSAGSSSAADPPAFRLTTKAWTPATGNNWFHAQWNNSTTNSFTSNATLMRLLDGSGIARIVVRATGTAGQIKIDKRNAAGTFTNLVTSAAGAISGSSIPQALDFFVNYAVSGQATFYVGGVAIADTGAGVDVTTDGVTTLGQGDLCCINTSGSDRWSECIDRDTTTLGSALQTLPPLAAGNTQSWTPNTVGNINEITINDSNNVSTSSANSLSEWTVATTLPVGQWTISSVQQEVRISRGASGPQNFEFLVRTSDGSDHVSGTTNPTTSLANYANNWPLNPHTSTAWNPGELVNSGVESLT